MKIFLKSAIGFMLALFVINLATVLYYYVPAMIPRTNAATNSILVPESVCINADEGFGIAFTDRYGYMNPSLPLEDKFVLMLGSSHLEGIQVMQHENMAFVLNRMLCGDSLDSLSVYNMGRSGHFLNHWITHLGAANAEFPGATAVVIEIDTTDITGIMNNDLPVPEQYIPQSSGPRLMDQISLSTKINTALAKYMPAARKIRMHVLNDLKLNMGGVWGLANQAKAKAQAADYDPDEYAAFLDKVFAQMHEQFSGPILFAYHPPVKIEMDGSMSCKSNTFAYRVFAEACERNGIIFLDMSSAFKNAYDKEYIVPYGFANTTMGTGHLNADGHRIMAEEIYKALESLTGGIEL